METTTLRNWKISPSTVDWHSKDSYVFFDPLNPPRQLDDILKKLPKLPGHICLFTSSSEKIVVLSKEACLISAQACNKHLQTSKKDSWLIALPTFHVSGLSILARSFVGDIPYYKLDLPWLAETFVKILQEKSLTLSSLVPAQVWDLVEKNLRAPSSLRAIIVGGSGMTEDVYQGARSLGWPLLPSYGLTEACSQVATASLDSLNSKDLPTRLDILAHMQLRIQNQRVEIKSPCLFKGYFLVASGIFSKREPSAAWFPTEDMGKVQDGKFIFSSRKDSQIKILGELVSLDLLSQRLQVLIKKLKLSKEFFIIPFEDARRGYKLRLVTTSFDPMEINLLLKDFNNGVRGFEKIKSVYCLDQIPKSSLSKIKPQQINKHLEA